MGYAPNREVLEREEKEILKGQRGTKAEPQHIGIRTEKSQVYFLLDPKLFFNSNNSEKA